MPLSKSLTIQLGARLLLTGILTAGVAEADHTTDSADSFRFSREILSDSVFQVRSRQRLLAAARSRLDNREYSAAFEHFHELLSQPADSAIPVQDRGPVPGIRSEVLQEIASQPDSVRRLWNRFCEGPARTALQQALQSRSRHQLARVAAEFPYSSVGAEALITETIWLINAHERQAAGMLLRRLRTWAAAGVLNRSQTRAIQKLELAIQTHSAAYSIPQSAPATDAPERLQETPAWTWQDSAWNHRYGPDVVPAEDPGPQLNPHSGWQHPLLTKNTVISRTPAGIVSLERTSGTLQWFLPCRPARPTRPVDDVRLDHIFEISPLRQQRLEMSGDVIYFVDGLPTAALPASRDFRSSIVLRQGATHLAAVRTGHNPTVLWQVAGTGISDEPQDESTLKADDFRYSIRPATPSSASPGHSSEVPESAQSGGHVFLSAPRFHAGRLYVTTEYDGITWLNCFSATHGSLLWQQPLSWHGIDEAEHTRDAAIVEAVTDDHVICLFASGLIAGCRATDGTISWIQSVLLNDVDDTEPDLFRMDLQSRGDRIARQGAGTAFGSLWLQSTTSGIVCGRRASPVLCSLNSSTGNVQWTVSRHVQGSMAAEQPDLDCIGVVDDRLILIGQGHCRAVEVSTGHQVWVRPLARHSGRICCDRSRVYALLDSGRLLIINGTDGSIATSQRLTDAPSGPALVADRSGVAGASAWSVRAWNWQEHPSAAADDIPRAELVRLTRQRLLDAGLSTVTSTSQDTATAAPSATTPLTAPTDVASMNAEQRLLLALLTPQQPKHDQLVREQLQQNPDQPVSLPDGWSVSLSRAARMFGWAAGAPDSGIPDADRVLYPHVFGSVEQQLDEAARLLENRQRNAAELLLLNMDTPDASHTGRWNELLRQARGSALAPEMAAEPIGPVTTKFHVEPSLHAGFRLSRIAGANRRFRLGTWNNIVPAWSGSLLTAERGSSGYLGLIDLEQGIETHGTRLSRLQIPANVTRQQRWHDPGLIPITQEFQSHEESRQDSFRC